MDFIDALKRPYGHGREFFFFVIFNMVPIASFLSMGYALRAAASAMQNKQLEKWTDWEKYFVLGLFSMVAALAYAIPVIVFGVLGIGVGVIVALMQADLAVVAAVPLVVVFIVLLLITVYLSTYATLAIAETGKLGAAFEFRRIVRRAFTMVFFVGYLKSIAVALIYGVIAVPLIIGLLVAEAMTGSLLISLVRLVLSVVISYPIAISSMTLLGEAYKQTQR